MNIEIVSVGQTVSFVYHLVFGLAYIIRNLPAFTSPMWATEAFGDLIPPSLQVGEKIFDYCGVSVLLSENIFYMYGRYFLIAFGILMLSIATGLFTLLVGDEPFPSPKVSKLAPIHFLYTIISALAMYHGLHLGPLNFQNAPHHISFWVFLTNFFLIFTLLGLKRTKIDERTYHEHDDLSSESEDSDDENEDGDNNNRDENVENDDGETSLPLLVSDSSDDEKGENEETIPMQKLSGSGEEAEESLIGNTSPANTDTEKPNDSSSENVSDTVLQMIPEPPVYDIVIEPKEEDTGGAKKEEKEEDTGGAKKEEKEEDTEGAEGAKNDEGDECAEGQDNNEDNEVDEKSSSASATGSAANTPSGKRKQRRKRKNKVSTIV